MENEQCLLEVMYVDISSVHASLLLSTFTWDVTLHATHASPRGLQTPLPPLGRQLMSLMLACSSRLFGLFYPKVMGISLLFSTSFSLLLGSQMGLVLLSLSNRDFPRSRPLPSEVAFSSPIPGDPEAERLTGMRFAV